MLVEPIAEVAHHVLADDIVEIGLADADDAGNDGGNDHDADEDDE